MSEAASAPAVFYDGLSSRRHVVDLRFGAALELVEDAAVLAVWPYAGIRAVDAPAGTLRLRSLTAPALARLELREPAAQHRLAERCPALSGADGQAVALWRITAGSLAAAGVIVGMIWFGLPLLADQVAALLPVRWERPLGQAVDNQIRVLFGGPACARPDGQAALVKLVAALQRAAQLPVTPDPLVLRAAIPNAFALPGGRIYVLSGLLDRARSPDELAGVLAHEFGHVAHRDGVRRLIRDGGTAFLVGLLFGDVSGAGAAVYATRSLLSAAYARDMEANADGFAIVVLHRLGRPTAPLAALLLRIAEPGEAELALLRDHPLTPERARRLAADAAAPAGPALLNADEWRALQSICR